MAGDPQSIIPIESDADVVTARQRAREMAGALELTSTDQTLLATDMGKVDLPQGAGHVRVIAGEYEGVTGPAKTFTPVRMLDVRPHAYVLYL